MNRERVELMAADPSACSSEYDAILRAIARTPDALRREDLIGVMIDGKYRVVALLGEGGMGTVYSAIHVGTSRAVALKVLVPELTASEGAVERFRREARAAGQMRHPNIVDVTDFGFAERGDRQLAYLVMELLRGRTLRAVLDGKRRMPLDVAIDVLDQVCAAVAQAHELGIVHRDIKPENIHLESEARRGYRVKVLDFGIAKLVSPGAVSEAPPPSREPVVSGTSFATTLPAARGPLSGVTPRTPDGALTRLGAVIGTPHYMAPEQRMGLPVDARADVYSLGVVAYELLAGGLPFRRGGPRTSENAAIPFVPLAESAPLVPPGIARAVEAALATDPAARPPSATALAAALRAGTETTGTLLRRAIALGLEHYGHFFRQASILTLPTVALAALSLTSSLLARAGFVPRRLDLALGAGVMLITALLPPLLSVAVAGLFAPLAADLIATGRVLRSPPLSAEIWRTLRDSLPSSAVKVMAIPLIIMFALGRVARLAHLDRHSLPTILGFQLVGLALGYAAIAPLIATGPVVALERMGGLAPLRRSATLMKPLFRTAVGVLLVWHPLVFAIDVSFNLATAAITKTPLDDILAIDGLAGVVASLESTAPRIFQLLESLVFMMLNPFGLLLPAMLYLSAREAEGNPVGR